MGGSSEGQEDIRQVTRNSSENTGHALPGESIERSTFLSLGQDQAISGAIGNQALYSTKICTLQGLGVSFKFPVQEVFATACTDPSSEGPQKKRCLLTITEKVEGNCKADH